MSAYHNKDTLVTPAIEWPTMATGVSQPRREIANRVGPRPELRSN